MSQNDVNVNKRINFNLLNLETRKNKIYDHSAALILNKILLIAMNSNQSYCIDGRHYSQTRFQIVYGKLNPKTQKLFRTIKGTCSICNRSKLQFFTK